MTNEQYITHFRDKWSMTITDDGNGGFLVNDTFAVTPSTDWIETFSGEKEIPVWVIEVEEIIRGGYHEPDAYEFFELARRPNLGEALTKVKELELRDAIERGLKAEFEAQAESVEQVSGE